ncbi:hypothetical protein F4780DRAFT_137628 [Xylariomycetidae sp. FL0641]|nr:hypothetical protein F4780DRAFT_137628 [Xylariomycetidae sp. FL0641]
MSHLLWKYYWENDVDRFRRLLAPAGYSQGTTKLSGTGLGSPGAFGSSPRSAAKPRKTSGYGVATGGSKNAGNNLGKAEVNSRDYAGLTVLLRAASSTSPSAIDFVQALLDHPAVDLYIQDYESGWNALHRALYNGNISIARLLLEKERKDLTDSVAGAALTKAKRLIKTKDQEGNSPFDVYNATIALRTLKTPEDNGSSDDEADTDDGIRENEDRHHGQPNGIGEEVFTFGSNKNMSLGLGDEDDRQYPERVYLKRPDHLIQYFYDQYLQERKQQSSMEDSISLDLSAVPALIQNRRLVIQDVVLSKLHSAILTTDPMSNLYICGVGRGGRLGLGDENTRFSFTPVQGGLFDKKVVQIALGQNHSLAVTSTGELWTWGSNVHSQLGLTLPPPLKPDEEPMSTTPRQVFGPLKKEIILGAAASSLHSVAHTGSSLFCWGKNIGQLALMDADSRSLEVQTLPRKVAATLVSNHSSISMVSAIDKATSCLFEDFTVCVFTSYGYKMVQFSFYDPFASSPLQRSGAIMVSSPWDPTRRQIHQIMSGGETIAAVSGNGDLYTMQINHKSDGNQLSMSTTNPSKIKDALTTPQCIWSSKKDDVMSASIGENGSVIISTLSGAVWRRVKRVKAEDTKVPALADAKRKVFKFERVPYITDVVGVRSSAFGAYAAIRRDFDVTREQIEVGEPTLWRNVAALCVLGGFEARNTPLRENKDTWKFQEAEVLRAQVDDLTFQVLTSTDLEEDLRTHLRNLSFRGNAALGTVIRAASNPDIKVPIHSWVLSARSSYMRNWVQRFRETGSCDIPDLVSICEEEGLTVINLVGSVDMITLLNLVKYMYSDAVIPAWNFTRQAPPQAYRYRQVRNEVMRLAKGLGMTDLEAAVRLQASPARSMSKDFRDAIDDSTFFEDGDALLQLNGDEIPVHSTLLCQRCPWFQGLFNGRSRGMWLDSRRAAQTDTDRVNIDMQHMDPESFHYVLQFLYADVGEELFDDVVADSIDDFSELVLDVMNIANELMLDRLSQICQKIIGQFVTTRNVSNLLNVISPCSVTEFKDKGLEYICLQMESMLENHLLDDLDEDLLCELDEIVRDNQLARCPFARSGRAELILHDQYPDLAQDIEEERQIRVKEMAYKANQKEDEKRLSSSFKMRFGSVEDVSGLSPTPEKPRRRSKVGRNEPFSPRLRPKDSQADLIFDMDEEEDFIASSPLSPSPQPVSSGNRDDLDLLPPLSRPRSDAKGKAPEQLASSFTSAPSSTPRPGPTPSKPTEEPSTKRSQGGNPWGASALPTSRLDLRDVLSEQKPMQSALSAGLAAEKKDTGTRHTPQKISQKEKKKQAQQQAEEAARQKEQAKQSPATPWTRVGEKKEAPWQKIPSAPKSSMQDLLKPESAAASPGPPNQKPLVASEASSSKSIPRRTASPDTRFSGQKSNSTPKPSTTPIRPDPQPPAPHSKSYIKRAPMPEQEFGLGLADIIGQQQREQQTVKEAVAKRSLQEIQQEQAFQEWWDQESRRMQEEEARRTAREEGKEKKRESGRRGRGAKAKGGGNRGGGSGAGGDRNENAMPETSSSTRGRRKPATRGGKASNERGVTK